MKRLLVVTPFGTTTGGAEQWLLGILADGELTRRGWTVDAIVLKHGPLTMALRDLGVTAIELAMPASPARIVARVPALRRAIRLRNPDVVVGNGVKAQLALTMALTGLRTPTVYVKHDHSHDRALGRLLGRTATLVVPTALEVGVPTGRQDLVVIEPPRPPVPLEPGEACAALASYGWRPHRRLSLGMITRLVPYKGVDLAIEALTDPRTDDWELVVIGGDDAATPGESERLLGLASSQGVADRVTLLGEIPAGGRLLGAFDAAGVLTRPGQQNAPTKEGYGIVATEAMMCAVPVIVAQPGPVSRRLATPQGPAGLTLDTPTAASLSTALSRLTDDTLRHQMGQRGLTAAMTLPTQADVANSFADVVESVGQMT